MVFVTLVSEPRPDYTLIDSGNGRKLESYGSRRFIRPEPQAMWEAGDRRLAGRRRIHPRIGRGWRRPLVL
jgi:hypothetical protein